MTAFPVPRRGIQTGAPPLGPPREILRPTAPLFGDAEGRRLTGLESRALRAALGLDRRHVADLANVLGLTPEPIPYAYVTNWERSKGDGYPVRVVEALNALERAVESLAVTLREHGGSELHRPQGEQGAFLALWRAAAQPGLSIRAADFVALSEQAADFWSCLADTAVARAARDARRDGAGPVAVVTAREPN